MSYKKDIEYIEKNICFELNFDDVIATKENFNILVDTLCKDNEITQRTYENIYLDMNKKNKKAYILCGSYKKKIGE